MYCLRFVSCSHLFTPVVWWCVLFRYIPICSDIIAKGVRFFVVFCSILQYIVLISAFGGWLVYLHVLARFGIFSHITTYSHIKLAFFYRLTLFTFCGVVWCSCCWRFGVCVCQKLPPLDTYFLKINSLRVVTIFFLL